MGQSVWESVFAEWSCGLARGFCSHAWREHFANNRKMRILRLGPIQPLPHRAATSPRSAQPGVDRPPATVAPALERMAKHARRIVFLSSTHKTAHPFFQQPNPVRVLHAEIERLIETSGLQWTFLRPGMFAANALWWWAPQIRAGDVVRWPYLAAPTAPIDERDIAAVAVRALCEDGHAGAEYVLTGPQSLSQLEQISAIGDVIGRSPERRREGSATGPITPRSFGCDFEIGQAADGAAKRRVGR